MSFIFFENNYANKLLPCETTLMDSDNEFSKIPIISILLANSISKISKIDSVFIYQLSFISDDKPFISFSIG